MSEGPLILRPPAREPILWACGHLECGRDACDQVDVELVHLRHFRDGYPLCWTQDQEGGFTATPNETLVDCPECLRIIAREDG